MANTNDSDPHDPGNAIPRKHETDPAFIAEFTQVIAAYGKAASTGQAEQAEAAALHMLNLASEEAQRNPSPELLLTEQARAFEARGDWADAEATHRQLLAMVELSDSAPHSKYGQICKTHSNLGSLLLLRGEYSKARESAAAAIAAARRTDLWPLLLRALELDISCALRVQDVPGALAAAAEAVRIAEPGALYDALRARAWISRARCLVAAGDFDGAEQDLVASQRLVFAKPIFELAAGLHGQAASWWEVRASLCERRGGWLDAVDAWTRAVERRRHVATLPHVAGPHTLAALARTLLRLGMALRETGERGAAEPITAEGTNIWRELGLPAQAAF